MLSPIAVLAEFAVWAHTADANVVSRVLDAIRKLKHRPTTDARRAYIEGILDALGVTDFPMHLLASDFTTPQKRMRVDDTDTDTDSDDERGATKRPRRENAQSAQEEDSDGLGSDAIADDDLADEIAPHHTSKLRVDGCFKVLTRDEVSNEQEYSYLRKNPDGSVMWFYTREQMEGVVPKNMLPPVGTGRELYASTHTQGPFSSSNPFVAINVAPTYVGVGMYVAGILHLDNPIAVINTSGSRRASTPTQRGKAYVDFLLARGKFSSKRLLRLVQTSDKWKSRALPRQKQGKCDVCGMARCLTSEVELGNRTLCMGRYCYDRVHLAYRIVHRDKLHGCFEQLEREFGGLVSGGATR